MERLVTIPTDGSAHWYTVDGAPMHSVENKSKPGEMRPTTLRDARKLVLFPSVTTVLDIIRKPALEDWKVRQGILSALTLPREEGESDDAFANRIAEDSQAESHKARDLGTDVHHAIADWLLTEKETTDPVLAAFLATYREWHGKHVDEVVVVEKRFCRFGYAGMVDLDAFVDNTRAVVDNKTQKGIKGKPLKAWDGWGEQLAGYADGLELPDARLLNVILDKNEPGRLEIVEHTKNRETLAETFQAALTIWCNHKGYDTRVVWQYAATKAKEITQ